MLEFNSKAISEHSEVPLADDGRFERLVDAWTQRNPTNPATGERSSTCYVASVGSERDPQVRAAQLSEIVALVQHQGGQVVGQESCPLAEPNPRTLLGTGAARALADRARAAGATMLVLDAELSPSQTRNLEDATGIAICDREAIILNVFLRHARTRRAKMQVEMAQLEYLRPRIRGVGLDMDQQTGGNKNARGPGETASELLARKLDGRLAELRKGLQKLNTSAETQRQQRADCQRIVLVGYTNAGKTSLMNALTSADLSARDMPFETLDTTSRCLTRHGGDIVLSDTVGFIRRLPERLLASFESTLSEIGEASLLVIVVDASDYERELQLETTLQVLERMGLQSIPRFYVFNKLDRLDAFPNSDELARWSGGQPWAVLSTRDTDAVAKLETALIQAVRREEDELTAAVPYAAAPLLKLIYGKCRVMASEATEDGLKLRIRGPEAVMARIRQQLGKATQ
ncbi:MAG TPA: GTPase HflX [Polyangiaceae bacterium]|nr:GTPase HflX [Polyangiaceae bacterium]